MKIVLGIMMVFIILIIVGFVGEQLEEERTRLIPARNLCPVGNTSTSFCIVKNGKPYYFAIEGWELPAQKEVVNMIKMGTPLKGLYVWLKVRTNLPLEIDVDEKGYVLVGGEYKKVLSADWGLTIRREGNITLIAYSFPGFPAQREDIEALLKAEKVRLYFNAFEYYDLLPASGCIGEACFTASHDFYMNYTPPPIKLEVLDIEGRCVNEELCLYNITFELREGYLFLYFYYDEITGRKSYADFPIPINVYVEKNGKFLPTDGYFLTTVVPPLPPNAFDIWREPEHVYLTTAIPQGVFTLVFKGDPIEPVAYINRTPIVIGTAPFIIGTPWGGTKVSPKLEVIEFIDMSFDAYSDGVAINEVRARLKNGGKIPLVVHHRMLKGKLDSEEISYIPKYGITINPGESKIVSLSPCVSEDSPYYNIVTECKPFLPLEFLSSNHTLKIGSIYTDKLQTALIPPLKVGMSVDKILKIYKDELSGLVFGAQLLVNNTWVAPIYADWIKVYVDENPLSDFYYEVSYKDIKPNTSALIDVNVTLTSMEMDMLYDILVKHENLSMCLGISCVKMPLSSFMYGVGEEVVLGDTLLKLVNVSVVDVVGIRHYDSWEDRIVVDYYKAPEKYSILVAYVEVVNNGIRTKLLDSIDIDDSVVITRSGVFELAYLDDLTHVENASSDIIINSGNLWVNIDLELRPNESYVIAFIFIVPRGAETTCIIVELLPHIAVFTI